MAAASAASASDAVGNHLKGPPRYSLSLEHLGDAGHAPRLVEAADRLFQAVQKAEANAGGRPGGGS
jgi:hypothetical protein